MEADKAAVLQEEMEAPAPVSTALTNIPKTKVPDTSKSRTVLTHVLAMVGVLVIWYVVTLFTPKFMFPTPQAVLKVMWDVLKNGTLWPNMAVTLRRTVLTLIGAMAIGTTLGIVMGINSYWESFTRNWVYMALSMPGIVWVMLCVLAFGINEMALWISVVFIVFPYVAVNVFEGVKAIDRELLDMGRAFKIKRGAMVWKIVLPSLTPYLVAAVRQNFATSWKMVTLAELFGATIGIGFMIRGPTAYEHRGVCAISATGRTPRRLARHIRESLLGLLLRGRRQRSEGTLLPLVCELRGGASHRANG